MIFNRAARFAFISLVAFLETMDVEFTDGIPQPLDVKYGYFGLGGWEGNCHAIEEFLIGLFRYSSS